MGNRNYDPKAVPTAEEQELIKELVNKHSIFVFQQLNKWMNQDGFMLSLSVIGEKKDINEH
ncbi:Uncharacterised protein [Serratia fonticola]|uniref:hypothetical protein n=1 Tax=Serratia fonticola TaxID=47917 RepID=UPI0021788535|nr:hypothetical protein [Serratia fonticola]CAI0697859.1 Uncharacterised protein [Serratia fonticola]